MRGSGNDTIFDASLSDSFKSLTFPVDGGGAPPGQVVQPKVLLAQWEVDVPGTLDIDYTLGIPVVTAWRDIINGYTLRSPSLAQSPLWIVSTGSMASHRPALSFDGLDDWLETLELSTKLNNLTGLSASMLVYPYAPATNQISRMLWVESGAAGKPRLGYARSGIAPDQFYADGVTLDSDTYTPVTGSTYPYEGWATHTVRRDYLQGTERVDFNGGPKAQATGINTRNYGSSTPSISVRIGAEDLGQNPGLFYIYGIKLYAYAMSDDEMLADAVYYGGRINA